jgi:hypothetical protein
MSTDRRLLFIFGGGDAADQISRSGPRISIAGSADLGKLLPNRDLIDRLLITRDHQPQPAEVSGYPVIVNMITEAENSANILGNLEKLLRGVPARVINPPEAVLRSTRDQVAALLTGIDGLIVPKTVRFRGSEPTAAARTLANAGIAPPIIVRQTGTHGGKIIGLFSSVEEAVNALERDGDHIATEFVDFRSADALYRKFRIFFIRHHRILRHMLISDHWSVHGHARVDFMAPRPQLIAEERAMFESDNPFPVQTEAIFDAIRQRMPLDFFGLDFALAKDGQVVLFEANATMSFMANLSDPRFEYLPRCIPPARAAFMELVGLSQ